MRLLVAFALLMLVAGCQTRVPEGMMLVPAEVGKARLSSTCGPDILKDPLGIKPTAGCTHLVFAGVAANFPRMAVWLFGGMYQKLPQGTFRGDILFIGGRSGAGAEQVGEGLAHFTVVSPSAVGYMAYKGVGLFSKAYPNLRGLFKLPQRDLVTIAVRADLGVKSFDEVIQKKIPLKVTTGLTDPRRAMLVLFPEFLKAYGSSLEELKSWGGGIVPRDRGGSGVDMIAAGDADAIFNETAIWSGAGWKELHQKIPMRVLSVRDDVMEKLGQFGFKRFERPLKRGEYPGVEEEVTAIDWSDWIVLAEASVPDDIAYQMTQIGVEQKEDFESQYSDIGPMGSKAMGQYLADPKEMWRELGVPLHPGAEKYFKEKGHIPE